MQVENLEERRLLTVTSAVFDTPFTSLVEDPANAAAVTANQPYITVITSGTSAAGPADTIFLAQTPAPATDAESSDFSLDNVVLPVGLPAGNYTIGLIDNSIIDNNTSTTISLVTDGGLTVNDDAFIEGTEQVGFSIPAFPSANSFHVHSILDEEAAEVSIGNVIEGDTTVAVTLTQTAGDANAQLEDTFTAVVQDLGTGSASSADFTFSSQPVVFPALTEASGMGPASVPLLIATVDDSLAEPTEVVDLAFTNGGTSPIVPNSHSPSYIAIGNDDVSIVDNEVVSIGFSTAMQMVDEDDQFGDNLFQVSLTIFGSGQAPYTLQDPLSIPVAIGGSASLGIDYDIIAPIPSSPLTFGAGAGNTTIPFFIETESGAGGGPGAVFDDSILEGDENVTLDLDLTGTIAQAGLLSTGYELVIKDDEVGAITLTKTDGDEDGTVPVTYTATITAPGTGIDAPTAIASTINLPFTLSSSDALLGFDYGGPIPSSPLTFAGVTCPTTGDCVATATLTVPVIPDNVLEPTESLTATFSGSSLLPASSSISADILDDDIGDVRISVTDMMGTEDDATAPDPDDQVGFDVQLNLPASVAVSATIDLDPSTAASLTAQAGIDFEDIFPLAVTFPAYNQSDALVAANTVQSVTVQIFDEMDAIPNLPFEISELTEELVVEITSVSTPVAVGNAGVGYSVLAQPDGRLEDPQMIGDQVGPRTLLIKDDPGDVAYVHVLGAAEFGGDEAAAEPNDNGSFTAVLLDSSSSIGANLIMTSVPIDVTIAGFGGTATLGDDYVVNPGVGPLTYQIPAGSFSTPINVIVVDDTEVEPTETVTTSLASHMSVPPTGYTGPLPTVDDGNPAVIQTVEIEDNDSINVVVTATDNKIDEDTSGNSTGRFRVALQDGNGNAITQPTSTAFTIEFSGSALFAASGMDPDDYDVSFVTQGGATGPISAASATLAIPANEQYVDFIVTDKAGNEIVVENDETVVATVSDAPGPDTSATIDICDNDSAMVHVNPLANAVEDGVVGTADGKFEFYLSAPSDTPTTVTFTVMGGTINPASSTDFSVINDSPGAPSTVQVIIPAFTSGTGLSTNPMITFDATADVLVEGTESVKVSVASVDAGDADISPGNAGEAFIADDDGTFVGVMAMDDTAFEDQSIASSEGRFTFSVGDLVGNANPNVTTDLTVNYVISGVNITNGDYSLAVVGQTPAAGSANPLGGLIGTATLASPAGSGSIVIPAGVTSVDVRLVAADDAVVEGSETLALTLTSINTPFTVGAQINPLKVVDTIDIVDNDDAEVFLTHQAIMGGSLPDEEAFEEGCVTGIVTNASGVAQTGCVGTGTTDDNVVPFIIGLTAPSSTLTTVTFLAGGPGTATADAEFEDFDIVGPASLTGPTLDPVSGLEQYSVDIPANTQFVTLEIHAVNDNDTSTGLASLLSGSRGVVEGTELVVTRLLPTAQGGASSNAAYTNSASTFEEITRILETDVAEFDVSDHVFVENANAGGNPLGSPLSGVSDPQPDGVVVTLLTDIEGQINVTYATTDLAPGSGRPSGGAVANEGSDYTDNDGGFPAFVNTLAGANNVTTLNAAWLIDAVDDNVGEPTEYYDLVLTASHNNAGIVDVSDVGLVTILDDDVIDVSVSSASIVEGDSPDTTTVTFTVNLDDSNQAIPAGTLDWATANISTVTGGVLGTGKDDFVPQNLEIDWLGTKFDASDLPAGIGATLSNGDKTLTFEVVINGDDVVEGDQQFDVDFDFTPALPSGAPIQTVTQTITIEDDDTANIRLTSGSNPVNVATNGDTTIVVPESNGTVSVAVIVDKAIEGILEVLAATSDGTATRNLGTPAGIDNDYNSASVPSGSPLVFPNTIAGANVSAFTTAIHEDTIVEGTERFNVDVSVVSFTPFSSSVVTPPPAAFNAAGGEVQINDNDNVRIEITPNTLSVSETAGNATFAATLLADTSVAPAASTGVQDAFSFDAVTTQGLLFGGFACGDDSHAILNCPGGDYDFTSLVPGDLTVTFPENTDLDGDGDLEVAAGTVVTFDIPINDDNIIEINELFSVNLDAGTFNGANAGDQAISIVPATTTSGLHEITILDDDAGAGAVVELRNPTAALEGTAPGLGTNGTFEIGLTNGLVTDVDITVTMLVGGTADTPNDVNPDFDIPGSVPSFSSAAPTLIYTIPAGQNSVVVDVVPVPDNAVEPTETVVPEIQPFGVVSSPARPGIGNAANSVQVDIIDDDAGITTRNLFVRGSTWGTASNPNTVTGFVAASKPLTQGITIPQFNVDTLEVVYNTPLGVGVTPFLLVEGPTAGGTVFLGLPSGTSGTSGNTYTFDLGGALQNGRYKATVIDGLASNPISFNVLHADGFSSGSSAEVVDFTDFAQLSTFFGNSSASNTVPSNADYNGDGEIDFVDFAALSTFFGNDLAGFLPPPPPLTSANFAVDSFFEDFSTEDDEDHEDFLSLRTSHRLERFV